MSPLAEIPTRALTLWQPWAFLVANGFKTVENRPKGFSHKSFRGEFWVHAGAGARDRTETVLHEQLTRASALCLALLGKDVIPPLMSLAYGAIVGRATITGILEPAGRMFHKPGVPWHFPEQYGFIVERAVALATPVPCRGYQGFWTVPPAVLEQLRGAA